MLLLISFPGKSKERKKTQRRKAKKLYIMAHKKKKKYSEVKWRKEKSNHGVLKRKSLSKLKMTHQVLK